MRLAYPAYWYIHHRWLWTWDHTVHSIQPTSPLDGSCNIDTGGPSQCPVELKGEEPWESSSKRAVLGTAVPADLRGVVSPILLGCTQLTAARHTLGLRTQWPHKHSALHDRRHSCSTAINILQFTLTFRLSWRAGAHEGHKEVFPSAPPPIHSFNSGS